MLHLTSLTQGLAFTERKLRLVGGFEPVLLDDEEWAHEIQLGRIFRGAVVANDASKPWKILVRQTALAKGAGLSPDSVVGAALTGIVARATPSGQVPLTTYRGFFHGVKHLLLRVPTSVGAPDIEGELIDRLFRVMSKAFDQPYEDVLRAFVTDPRDSVKRLLSEPEGAQWMHGLRARGLLAGTDAGDPLEAMGNASLTDECFLASVEILGDILTIEDERVSDQITSLRQRSQR